MPTESVRQGIIIGVGRTGAMVVDALRWRLNQRLGGVPVIRLLALVQGEDAPPDMGAEVEVVDLSLDPAQMAEPARRMISRWLPDLDASMAEPEQLRQTRVGGRLALSLQTNRVHLAIRDATNAVLDMTTQAALVARGMQVAEEGALYVYIIAALDDPFASGCFIDLSYLVSETIGRTAAARQLESSGILFLPSHESGGPAGSRSAAEIQALRETEQKKEADCYAALRELDFFMDKRRFVAAFWPGQGSTLVKAAPFSHSCYLVDSINKQGRGMPSLDQRVEMVGEWLYEALASPLKEGFQARGIPSANVRSWGKVPAYSGLGLGAYFVPVDEMIDACSYRMGAEMLGGHILRQPQEEGGLPSVGFGVRPQEVDGQLRDDAAWEYKIERFTGVSKDYFRNIDPRDLSRLEGLVRRTFDFRLAQMMVRIRRGIVANLGQSLAAFEKKLADEVTRGINLDPSGGLSRVQRLLLGAKQQMDAFEKSADADIQTKQKSWRDLADELQKDRANHVAAVRTFGTKGAIAALSISVLALLVAFYYAQLTLLDRLQLVQADFKSAPVIASILLFLGLAAALFLAGYVAYHWWERSREAYIETHRQRLKQAIEIELKRQEKEFFKSAQKISDQQIQRLVDFQMRLEDLRDWFQAQLAAPRPLYGSPRFATEESLIDERDLATAYDELTRGSLTDELEALFARMGALSHWKDISDEQVQMEVLDFGRSKFGVLRQTRSAEEMLVHHATPGSDRARSGARPLSERDAAPLDVKSAVRVRAMALVDNSMPFLAYDDLAIESSVRVGEIKCVAYEGARDTESLITQVLDEKQMPRIATNDRHSVVCMTAYHGIPLAAISAAVRGQKDYESLRAEGQRPLHTERSYLVLPDIHVLGQNLLEPQMAVAMGTAYDLLEAREEDGHLTYEYLDDLDEPVRPDLGADRVQACLYLQSNTQVLRLLSARIEQETERRAEEVIDGQKKGNRGLIRELRLYARRKREDRAIDDWEEIMIDDYVTQLER